MLIKVCGLNTVASVRAALEAGADALGFVFAESPRQVTPEQAVALCGEMPPGVIRVAVMRHPTPAAWNQVRDVFRPDWLQTDAADYAILDVPESIGRLPVYRDTDYGDASSHPERDWPEHILFEGARSGAGERADWGQAARIARQTCMMLAGGLSPDNVGDAIVRVHPWGVDVSSGVESASGVKDPAKIAAFVAAARKAEDIHAG